MPEDESPAPWNPIADWARAEREAPVPIGEMAQILGVKLHTFTLWAKTGRVPAFRIGARWYCVPATVIADIVKPLAQWAPSNSSVVYRYLREKLRGSLPVPADPADRTVGPKPGLVEPRPSARKRDDTPDDDGATLLTRRELAARLKSSQETVARLTLSGEIPSFKVGHRYRYDLDAVKAALATPHASWSQSERSRSRRRIT